LFVPDQVRAQIIPTATVSRHGLKMVHSFSSVHSKKNLMPQMAMVAVLRA
jgi:hypothetical protein